MTYAQKVASDPKHSVYVSASAGSGKTKVLTDRVLRILLDGTPPGKIMCLTFTNAAAAEMANRVNNRLMAWTTANDADLFKSIYQLTSSTPDSKTMHLARKLFVEVLDTPDGIKIQTIHSFCQNLMKRFPLEAGVMPHFDVIDEKTSHALLQQAKTQLLMNQGNYSDEIKSAINNILWRVYEGNFTSLMYTITNEREKIEYLFNKYSQQQITNKINTVLNVHADETEASIIERYYQQSNMHDLQNLSNILASGSKTDITTSKQIKAFIDSNASERIAAFTRYKSAFINKNNTPRKKMTTAKIISTYPQIVNILDQEQQRILSCIDHQKSVIIARLTIDLLHIGHEILCLYKQAKNTRACLDYNDLIITSNKLLQKSDIAPWILYKLDGGIDHLLIDEAQDTSPIQWQVIEALCAEFFAGDSRHNNNRTIFIVGDEKQSIFSFQGADPQVFCKMQDVFSARALNVNKGWQMVALDKSFRSTEPILKCVDAVFADAFIRSAITFNVNPIEHQAHRNLHAGLVEMWPLIEKPEKNNNEPWHIPTTRIKSDNVKKLLAEKIADNIRQWINSKRVLASAARTVQPGDVMILVRKRDSFVDYMVQSLKHKNIPVAGIDRMILTDHIAVMDLIAIGNFLLLPDDNLTLATVLKSPLLDISEDALYELAHNRGASSLWSVLGKYRNKTQQTTFHNAYQYLAQLLHKLESSSPFDIYSYILDGLNGRKQLASRLGKEINDPVDEFLSLALSYEKTHPPSLQGFLSWLQSSPVSIKRDLEQGNNSVRIMTVHGSKGLQAPIIFLADTTSIPRPDNTNIFWTEANDPIMLWTARSDNINNLCHNMRTKQQNNAINEYYRLLYVAMTRAEDELYITGYKDGKNIPQQSWYNVIKSGLEKLTQEEHGILRFTSQQKISVPNNDLIPKPNEKINSLPAFVDAAIPEEVVPSIPLTPSKIGNDNFPMQSPTNINAVLRGDLIHKLLEYLPDICATRRDDVARNFLQQYKNNLSQEELRDIRISVLNIMQDENIRHIFSSDSLAEVAITGLIGDYTVAGQVDRLVIKDDHILILDYKTHQNPPDDPSKIHSSYLKQMAAYKGVISQVYPDTKIKCALLWTSKPKIMMIDDTLTEGLI